MNKCEISDLIHRIKITPMNVCIWGTGKVGRGRGFECLKEYNISVNYYSDSNPEMWGRIVRDGIVCISPYELRKLNNVIVFIMCSFENTLEVYDYAIQIGIKNVIKGIDILYCDDYTNRILGLDKIQFNKDYYNALGDAYTPAPMYDRDPISNPNNKRIAIYTCISGEYDALIEPQVIEDDIADYYYISETCPTRPTVYNYIDLQSILPKNVNDNIRRNRFCKILGCDIFSEYAYNIYIDGNLMIRGSIGKYINMINASGIALRKDSKPYDCIYQEAAWSIYEFDNKEIVQKQMQRYYIHGMPRHYGAFCCNVLVRDNQNKKLVKTMRDWWGEVYSYSFRDQNSFTYALWKNNYLSTDISILDGNWSENEELVIVNRHR